MTAVSFGLACVGVFLIGVGLGRLIGRAVRRRVCGHATWEDYRNHHALPAEELKEKMRAAVRRHEFKPPEQS